MSLSGRPRSPGSNANRPDLDRFQGHTSTPGRLLGGSRRAGYGKTTLLSQWAERNGQAFAGVSVDDRDNDPKVLLAYGRT